MKSIKYALVALVAAGLLFSVSTTSTGFGEEACKCAHCKKQVACTKVCHLVCEEKKIEITCWGCECEEFCIPGPSTPKCEHCKDVKCSCVEGVNPKVASKPKTFSWTSWLPGGATVQTRKKLMKRTTTETAPSHKWVVEDLCMECKQKTAYATSK
jgi:hypothetical protein